MTRWGRWGLAAAAAILVSAPPASAATFDVVGTADTPAQTGCAGTQCPSLRAALVSAALTSERDTIRLPAGEYQLTTDQLVADTPVDIVGAGARSTVVHANPQAFRVLNVPTGSDVSVSGVTLRDGFAFEQGSFFPGGVVRNSGTLKLDGVRVTGGNASSGGGIANTGGTLTIDRSLVDHNAANVGGGDSGGILNFGGGTLTVRDSTIADNTASLAGAYLSWGAANVPNTARFEHVTVAGNAGSGRGIGGLAYSQGDTLQLRASIVAGNLGNGQPSNCDTPPTSLGANVESGTECGFEVANQPVGLDGDLADLGGETDTIGLLPSSPALDLDRGDCAGTDQRGVPRPLGAGCDAGALELGVYIASGPTGSETTPAFTFGPAAGGMSFECGLDGVFAACTSPWTAPALANGTYSFNVRALSQGAVVNTATRTFTVAVPTPAATASPTPSPTPTPTPTATPSPTPVAGRSVVTAPQGPVRVKLPGSSRFVPLAAGSVPVGATIDAKQGQIEITAIPKPGAAPETATFYDGIFKLTQKGGYTILTMTEQLAPCPKGAGAAAKKPKTRRLWGSGKGHFRTSGRLSSATVRGTKWLVQDSCAGTLTRVTQGAVTVRDFRLKRNIVVRAGKRYLARPKG